MDINKEFHDNSLQTYICINTEHLEVIWPAVEILVPRGRRTDFRKRQFYLIVIIIYPIWHVI